MLLYTLIVLWFAKEGHRTYQPLCCPLYRSKSQPSFADMLSTLKLQSVHRHISSLAQRNS